ncbi:MucBP domain-containing protein [Enterococcus ureasiticus]|uniref:MucBP domain-containing protein n=1 Tax=Enterococcus ureasiticus TaxID=903984 RepID=UPI001A8E42DB|nr:MucBP domain-containing protein [Enterococcus ureasiticus]MBO0474922.1 MucBP domain-containing protein [Enterococcus ureasiticus]
MKNRTIVPLHKKTTIHAVMLLAPLAPTILSSSFVFAEDNTPATEQTTPSQTQESTEMSETTLESSSSLESSVPQESTAISTSTENETPISTTDTTTEDAPAAMIAPRADTITIADPILKQTILSTLGLPADSELTQADMDRLTNLSLNSAQISSLSGLEHATNLNSIYMNTTNNITDFSPLEQLTSLTYVTLQTKSLTSTNFPDLSKNIGITNLSLGSTSIDDTILPKIAQLTSLTRIYMDSNMNITTIAPFKALPNLKSLSVQFCGITDFTVIKEFPVLNDLAAFGQNTGRNDLPTTIGRSSLEYDFDQETLFIPFSMMPNRLTNFDGYVPPFTTSNSASNTYLDFNGTQLPASRLQITDQGITIAGVTEDEFANLSTFEYNARLNNPAGSYAQPPGFAFYAISSGTYLHQFNVLNDGEPVTIHYQDTDGNKLLPTETRSGLVGQAFNITAPDIPDYELTQLPNNASGNFTDQEQTVTFVYKTKSVPIIEIKGKVTAYYVDTNDKVIKKVPQTDTIGKPFTTEQLEFKGYTFKEVKGKTTGTFAEEDQEVTYIYTEDEDKTDPTTSTDSSETTNSTTSSTEKTTNNTGTKDSADQVTNSSSNNSQTPKTGTSSNASAKKKLPDTGEQSNYAWLVLGLVIIGFVNYQYVLKKVKQEK